MPWAAHQRMGVHHRRRINRAFVANRGSSTVNVLDDQTGRVLHTVVSATIASRQFRG